MLLLTGVPSEVHGSMMGGHPAFGQQQMLGPGQPCVGADGLPNGHPSAIETLTQATHPGDHPQQTLPTALTMVDPAQTLVAVPSPNPNMVISRGHTPIPGSSPIPADIRMNGNLSEPSQGTPEHSQTGLNGHYDRTPIPSPTGQAGPPTSVSEAYKIHMHQQFKTEVL